MPRILVTGAAGYVGRELTRRLAGSSYDVVGTYRKECPTIANVDWIECDIRGDLRHLPIVDYVIHAAIVHPLNFPTPSSVDYLESNANATLNVARWSRRIGVSKFILFSTMTTYGTVMVPKVTEDVGQIEPSIYGITKYLSEKVLESFDKDFSVYVLRLPGVVGPNIVCLGRPWLSTVVKNAIEHKPIEIFNGDSLYNNVIDIHNIANACMTIVQLSVARTGLFHLAGTKPIQLREVIDRIVEGMSSNSLVRNVLSTRNSYYISTRKIRTVLEITPDSTMAIIDRLVDQNLSGYSS